MPSAIKTLITANVIGFLLELGIGDSLLNGFALWPLQAGFMPWQLVSYAFLHAGIAHLAFNMFGLWMFGREMELVLGSSSFLRLYFASVLAAGATQVLVSSLAGAVYPTLGASGGVFGVLLAFAMFFPNRIIMMIFPPIPMPAWLFVTLYGCLELTLGVTGTQAGVAHFAHLGGMAGAYLALRRRRGPNRFR